MNTWITLTDTFSRLAGRGKDFNRRTRTIRRRLAVFLAVVGPGLITSNVDNDAGGIATYTTAGAQFGYTLLWSLIPMTIALYVSEEMCARMGVVTGKGLSDLIREEFGFRSTFFVMTRRASSWTSAIRSRNSPASLLRCRSSTSASTSRCRWRRSPCGFWSFAAAIARWKRYFWWPARSISRTWSRRFWPSRIGSSPRRQPWFPIVQLNAPYLLMLIGLIGTTIAPWQFFYLQAGFVEKRVGPRQYKHARMDVLVGSISCMVIVFFIIVCCAATLNLHADTQITDAGAGCQALVPLAGKWAGYLFAFGLLNASLFAASILPLSTAHVICEGLGFEAGLDRKLKEAPTFYSLYTVLIVVGAGIILIPKAPLLKILVLSQVANGVWLPVVLIFILLLINRRDLMGDHVNTLTFNIIAWGSSIIMIILTLMLVYVSIFEPSAAGLSGSLLSIFH